MEPEHPALKCNVVQSRVPETQSSFAVPGLPLGALSSLIALREMKTTFLQASQRIISTLLVYLEWSSWLLKLALCILFDFFFFFLRWNISKSLEAIFCSICNYFILFLFFWACPKLSWADWVWIFLVFPQCVSCECDLGGSSSGAEVRIRNNQLFCNDCYLRFKCKRANQGENFLSFEENTGSHAFPWTSNQPHLKPPALDLQALGLWVCPLPRGHREWVRAQDPSHTRAGGGAEGLERAVCPTARRTPCAFCSESGEAAHDLRVQTNRNRHLKWIFGVTLMCFWATGWFLSFNNGLWWCDVEYDQL